MHLSILALIALHAHGMSALTLPWITDAVRAADDLPITTLPRTIPANARCSIDGKGGDQHIYCHLAQKYTVKGAFRNKDVRRPLGLDTSSDGWPGATVWGHTRYQNGSEEQGIDPDDELESVGWQYVVKNNGRDVVVIDLDKKMD